MKLEKPSPSLITEFKWVVSQLAGAGAEPRKMFGYDAAFVNGNMAVGLWANTCVVKVSEADQAELKERGLAKPFAPMKDRVMGGWLELSEELAHDPEELLEWSRRAVLHTATLPPKLKRATKKQAGAKKSGVKKVLSKKATRKGVATKKSSR
jgi:TfoX/Sxy family transcriptional regulator of competence genes